MALINSVTIVGGGTAGWLTAGLIAAQHSKAANPESRLRVTLIESDDVHPIGVGEGTWPTMRKTLHDIGIDETDIIKHASATFKQASKFVGWHTSDRQNSYFHPFSAPQGSAQTDITPYWLAQEGAEQYAHAVCFQPELCELGLAPKPVDTKTQRFSANYGYHLDAGMFIALVKKHCIEKLGIEHVVDNVASVDVNERGIAGLHTTNNGVMTADLFIDCSGFSALLIEKSLNIGLVDASSILFADTALVCQLPYENSQQAIACETLSTAQHAGWIWDIGLQTRRGTGYVHSSAHQSESEAVDTFTAYLKAKQPNTVVNDDFRKIKFKTGYRTTFWEKNCVAVGLSSGFLEPLEASSLMLIEQSARLLSAQLPANTQIMPNVATRFNNTLTYMWERTIEFLKLHYILSNRQSSFWTDNKCPTSIPDRLQGLLEEWKFRPILESDFPSTYEPFSAQSYRYILYGMSHQSDLAQYRRTMDLHAFAQRQFQLNKTLKEQLKQMLPSHRGLLDAIISH